MFEEDYADYDPDPCPECQSDRTYWLYITEDIYRCEDCGLIIDDEYWKTEPPLAKGSGYPKEK